MLPGAQVGEVELEEIVKIGQAGENAKALVGDGNEASGRLLSDYEGLDKARMARTPRTAPQREFLFHGFLFPLTSHLISDDNVMTEALNLRNMIAAQTPLLGDENTPLHVAPGGGTGFDSATPRHQVAQTPNPLATPLYRGGLDPSATPRTDAGGSVAATPLRTPMRDNLSINSEGGYSAVGDTPRERMMFATDAKRALRQGWAALPKPENNFELLVPEDEDEDPMTNGHVLSEEDAAERDAREKRRREEEERRALARRSQVVKRTLPRPANVDPEQLLQALSLDATNENAELADAQRLIDHELVQLLQHDSIAHPIPGTSRPGGTQSFYEMPDDDAVAEARRMIHLELATTLGYPTANEEQVKEGLNTLMKDEEVDETESWAQVRRRLAYDAETSSWVDPNSLSPEARIAGYNALLDQDRETMSKEANRANKLEKKLGVTLGGYQARSKALTKRITDAFDELQRTQVDHTSFSRLSVNEAATGPRRVEALREEVDKLEKRERMLQERYAELDAERREAHTRISALEEKVMAEAEALNEAALAEMEE